ncbi:MAG TPA: MGMT family protein, partial [Methanothrix sp.]|nr:MGMT family protein [Methanothrix sp.]
AAGSAKETDPTEGVFLEPLGLYLLVERRGDRIRGSRFSPERPDKTLPDWWKEVLLRCWLGGEPVPFGLDLSGLTPFQGEVLHATSAIPPGETATYGEIAERLGRPGAARAVGTALRRNPLPLIIPCHRVVGSRGVGGYSPGVDLKRRILEVERGASPR